MRQAYFLATVLMLRSMIAANRKTDAGLSETRRATEFAERSFRFSHRPALHVEKIEAIDDITLVEPTARLVIRNAGSAFAYDVLAKIGVYHARGLDTVSLDRLPGPTRDANRLRGRLPPGRSITIPVQYSLDGSLPTYIAGTVLFHDDFGEWTEYKFSSSYQHAEEEEWWSFHDESMRHGIYPGGWVTRPS